MNIPYHNIETKSKYFFSTKGNNYGNYRGSNFTLSRIVLFTLRILCVITDGWEESKIHSDWILSY